MGRNIDDNRIECNKCKRRKGRAQFYRSNSPLFNGYAPICKKCVHDYVDIDNIETVHDMLRQLDIKFDIETWEREYEKGGSVFGNYLRQVNGLRQFRNTGWKDSIFEKESPSVELNDEGGTCVKNGLFSPDQYEPTYEDYDNWGYGYSPEEYYYFNKKYQQLSSHYSERTSLHTEALFTYIRYKVKEELAIARGYVKEAKDWGNLAKGAAEAANLTPSKLTKADLTDGLDSFSQFSRSVEQAVDVIPILPRFKERPQDRVDVNLWLYVNYIRDMMGLPPAEYKDIYHFYEERKKEYESMIEDLPDQKGGLDYDEL